MRKLKLTVKAQPFLEDERGLRDHLPEHLRFMPLVVYTTVKMGRRTLTKTDIVCRVSDASLKEN